MSAFALFCRGSLPAALHEEAFTCLAHSVGQVGGGLPCSVDPRVWLLDEVVMKLKQRKSVVQVRTMVRRDGTSESSSMQYRYIGWSAF